MDPMTADDGDQLWAATHAARLDLVLAAVDAYVAAPTVAGAFALADRWNAYAAAVGILAEAADA